MRELSRRTGSSHDRAIKEIKQEVMPHLPPKKGVKREKLEPLLHSFGGIPS